MTYKTRPSHLRNRDGIYHFIRRIPADLRGHYRSDRICLSLRTKSAAIACRAANSISQRLNDCWSGWRLQKMDVPAIHPLIGNKYDANSGGQSYISVKTNDGEMFYPVRIETQAAGFVSGQEQIFFTQACQLIVPS